MASAHPPLDGVRVIECSLLGPAAITTGLADLGADVIKVESPSGDYVRQMTWPIVEGTSLMHLHVNRGKRSVVLDLKSEPGKRAFRDLVATADAVVEAMRPGVLDRLGLGYESLLEVNPRIVFCTISGYGMTGPYRNLPSHGIAYDTWAGIVTPAYDDEGFCYMPEHVSIGINAGPLYGALYAMMVGFIDPDSGLGILISVEMVIMAALGGAGTLFGPLLGALILVPLRETTNSLFGGSGTGITYVIYGGIIVLLARFRPGGLIGIWQSLARRRRARAGLEARPRAA